jgi:hypothetical protein
MKVEIIRDKGEERAKFTGNETEAINFDGNTIMPWYINVLSIRHYPDKLVIRMNSRYKTIVTADYDLKNHKGDYKLWIMGEGVEPTPEMKEKMM